MKRIGILSGMGAMAGARFLIKLIQACQRKGASCDADFPEIVLFNLPSKGMDNIGLVDPELMKADLLHGIDMLNRCEVDVIVVVCNTVHLFFNHMQHHSMAPIWNLVSETVEYCTGKSFGVLSSRTTRDSHLYPGVLATDEQQEVVDKLIDRVICGINNRDDIFELYTLATRMAEQNGIDVVILGCTELSILNPHTPLFVDPAELAIEELIR